MASARIGRAGATQRETRRNLLPSHTRAFHERVSLFPVTAARDGTEGTDCHDSKPEVSVGA